MTDSIAVLASSREEAVQIVSQGRARVAVYGWDHPTVVDRFDADIVFADPVIIESVEDLYLWPQFHAAKERRPDRLFLYKVRGWPSGNRTAARIAEEIRRDIDGQVEIDEVVRKSGSPEPRVRLAT